jgi:hypothetical protein
MIAALEKAQAMATYARTTGTDKAYCAVGLSKVEAFELIEHWATEFPEFANTEAFALDRRRAKENDDPWIVLQHMTVLGLDLIPMESLQ